MPRRSRMPHPQTLPKGACPQSWRSVHQERSRLSSTSADHTLTAIEEARSHVIQPFIAAAWAQLLGHSCAHSPVLQSRQICGSCSMRDICSTYAKVPSTTPPGSPVKLCCSFFLALERLQHL